MRTCGSSSRPPQRMGSASSGRPPSASGPYSSSWTLLRFVRVRDANDYAVVTAALEPLVTLARETGAHVLAVHHEGKLTGTAVTASSATAFFGAVDTALLLRRSEKYRTLSSAIRRRPGGDDPRAPPRDPLGIGWEWAASYGCDDCAPRTQGRLAENDQRWRLAPAPGRASRRSLRPSLNAPGRLCTAEAGQGPTLCPS
jgi:hypothetical protein